jgi:glycosyltransferase 2 family protein
MDSRSSFEQLRRAVVAAERLVPWLALAAAILGLLLVFRANRGALAGAQWMLPWQAAVSAALAFAIAPLLQGLSFWLALRMLTGTTPLGEAMVVWSRSYIIRYAPTGALAVAYRLASRQRLHATAEQVLAAYGYEHVATLGAGAAACLLVFALAGGLPPWPALLVSVGALALAAALRPGAAGRALDRLGRRFGLHISAILPARQLVLLVALNAIGWLGTGAGVYALVAAATGETPGFRWLVGAYTAGYLVGFVAPLAPGGLGAREGMLVVLLRGTYGLAQAAAISLSIRLVNVAGELFAVALVHCAYGAGLGVRRVLEPPVEVEAA